MLNSARMEAVALDPVMRAFVLWEIAKGYERLDPHRADAFREEAFAATQAIDEGRIVNFEECFNSDACQMKQRLQREILQSMVLRSPGLVEGLLRGVPESVRCTIINSLISEYTDKKSFDRAEELLTRETAEKNFPYHAASQLMRALPKERAGDNLTIFMQAVENFRRYGGESIPDSQDLAIMVLSFWRNLPGPVVLDAIDALLEQARAAEESGKMHLSFKSRKTNASFSSTYAYRLFQIFPVLKELDDSRAEDLLRENQENEALLQRFPGGYQSLISQTQQGSTTAESNNGFSLAYQFGASSPETINFELQENWIRQVNSRREQIEQVAREDPRQAISDALGLPVISGSFLEDESPRAETLLTIARMTIGRNVSASQTAVEEVHETLAKLSLVQQARLIIKLGEMYLQLGDSESGRQTVKDGLKIAEKLYARDSDAGDPNQVIKAEWPSSIVWCRLLSLSARISPTFASHVLTEIPDPEIATLGKVQFGKTLLGSPADVPVRAQEHHREGRDQIVHF